MCPVSRDDGNPPRCLVRGSVRLVNCLSTVPGLQSVVAGREAVVRQRRHEGCGRVCRSARVTIT
jgi:hypothetical protein